MDLKALFELATVVFVLVGMIAVLLKTGNRI